MSKNPQALAFYEYMGFTIYRRSELDEQGNPFPILFLHSSIRIINRYLERTNYEVVVIN